MTAHSGRSIWMRVVSLIAIGFGLMTIWEGGAVLFVDGAAERFHKRDGKGRTTSEIQADVEGVLGDLQLPDG